MTNESGDVTDTLVFDAFGNETKKTGTSDNSYGFQGEEQDATGLYYLRARYMDPSTGTFTSMDTYSGSLSDPMSLHKYMFANSNPVMYSDPSGHFSLMEMDASMAIDYILNAGYMSGYLYIIDANITDPNLEHHNFMGYLGAIGAGMLFATMGLVLSATVTGLLILAIIDTLLGVAGTVKGVIDILNGHPLYGGIEIVGSAVLVWFGWRNYAGARSAAKAVSGVGYSNYGDGGNPIFDDANYAQKTYGKNFSADGQDYFSEKAGMPIKSIDDLVYAINKGYISPEDVPIDYIVRDGNVLILNTRSSQALNQAGVPKSQWNGVDRTGAAEYEMRLDGQLARNGLTNTGTPTVRQSGGKNG